MNNYYPYGYSTYPGQPPAQPYAYPTAPSFPPPTYPPPPNNAFEPHPQLPDPYDQSQSMIPGLGYGQPPQGYAWQQPLQPPPHLPQPPPPPPMHTPQQWAPREEPKLIPASQYYPRDAVKETPRTRTSTRSGLNSKQVLKQATKGVEDAEEGELSEGEFEDLYEPGDAIMDTSPRQPRGAAQLRATTLSRVGNGDGTSAPVSWDDGSKNGGVQSPTTIETTTRDRSGSYSPYLSPGEMHTPIPSNGQHITVQKQQDQNHGTHSPRSGPALSGDSAVAQARKKAQAAILNLWPLDVRYQQYVDEGIDEAVIKNLFVELGLDISTPRQSTVPGSSTQVRGDSQSTAQASTIPSSARAATAVAKPPVQDQAVASSAKSAGEERKDRIARLLAAKGAKAATSASTTGPQVDPKPGQAPGMSDKELALQQKMDALQKSREARAQKAAVRKGSLQAPQSKEPSPTSSTRPPSATTDGPVASSTSQLPQPVVPVVPQKPTTQPGSASASSIPGLFLSAAQSAPVTNQRKRPVATDFVSSIQTNKRPFGYHRQDKPFVIDVSDASEDEDVEMEIGSPTDEPTNSQQTGTSSQKTTSFRDFPPLTDGRPQLSPAPSNIATPQSGIITAQPKQAHLEVMDKQIEAMKRKIALAEARRKLKAAMSGQSSSAKSNAQTPDNAVEPDGSKPAMRRVQSMGASNASDQPNGRSSPVVAEASSSMRLPKPSEKGAERESSRSEKLRAVSTNLPLVEGRLQAKKSKLRLLQSQVARLQKEIEEEDAEKDKLTQEMEQLNQDSDSESSEPQSQLKSNSVDPLITQTPTKPQSEVQAPVPDVEATVLAPAPSEAGALASPSGDIPKSPSPVPQNDEGASTVAQVNNAVTGKAAASPHEAPDSANHAVPATLDNPASQVTSADEAEELRPATSSSDGPSDVDMDETEDSSSQDEEQESSEAYEPPEAIAPVDAAKSPSISPVPAGSTVSLANSDTDLQQPSSRGSPVPEQISLGVNESTPEQGVDAVREVPSTTQNIDEMSSGDRFTPYESPLQYFRAYRYHPKYAETVAGGLRSLTYSNRIDPNLPVCPDQLASRECPRGADCIYQHFETMKLPDDQILLQLGGTQLDGAEKAQYNDGLRKLLQEMRTQNIKDFPSIAQGIVDYHQRFTGDPSKILPLGNVSI